MRVGPMVALALALVAGCSPGVSGRGMTALPSDADAVRSRASVPVGQYIKHVVIVVQENRSFDNLFAGFKGADARTYGYTHKRKKLKLHTVSLVGHDMPHGWAMALLDWDRGKMDGFDQGPTDRFYPYAYVKHDLVEPYWALARQYVLADHMFPTMFGPSFTAHLDLIAGNADLKPTLSEVNLPSAEPWGCDAPRGTITATVNTKRELAQGPAPCFTQFRTIANVLDAAKLSWKYYAPPISAKLSGGGSWTAFDSIESVRYGPDWNNIVTPQSRFLTDVAGGSLAAVTWVIPDWRDSDHPGAGQGTGPSWVAAVVNAIGTSQFWNSTAIVVVWDDWGGWYDHVPPPQMDFRGLGIRVPCIIVSPYAKAHYVSHTVYEFGSILRFVEQAFDLPAIGPAAQGYTDRRAASIVDSFDFTQAPRAFHTIRAPYPPSHFINERPSMVPPDNE